MSDIEKPLNVQVAEALGCTLEERRRPGKYPTIMGEIYGWGCGCPHNEHYGRECGPDGEELTWEIAPYGEDSPYGWACTGPLITRYGIGIAQQDGRWWAGKEWMGAAGYKDSAPGPTVLIAVCNLILALHKAGKLEAS